MITIPKGNTPLKHSYNVEDQYLDLLNTVMVEELDKYDRTGVGTRYTHGAVLRHNCSQGFPLLTSKKVNFDIIKAELLWFLSGSVDNRDFEKLLDGQFNIWKANFEDYQKKLREYYDREYNWDSINNRPKMAHFFKAESKLANTYGALYGKMWRAFPSEDNFEPGGGYHEFDQIKNAFNLICNNPESRRIIVNGWNAGLHHNGLEAALPPCHVLHQYDVDQTNMRLNLSMYQRSGDLFLGVPFNLGMYALMLEIMSNMVYNETGKLYKPGMLVLYIHDAHVYHNHFEAVKTQLSRRSDLYNLPKIVLDGKINIDNPEEAKQLIRIEDYKYHPYIKAEMAV